MLSRARWTVMGTVLGVSACALGAGMAGCSGDDTVVPPDAAPDTTTDVKVDAPADVGTDAKDGGADVSVDAFDPQAIKDFAAKQVENTCLRLGQCCFGNDASAFDQTKCKVQTAYGVESNLQPIIDNPSLITPRLKLDPALAASCLAESLTFTCPSAPSTEYEKTTADCFGALTGVQPTGALCFNSIECAPGNYCKAGTGDAGTGGDSGGGTGLCAPLLGNGGPCNSANNNAECQYRGFLGTKARCDVQKAPDGGPAPNTCTTPRSANGTACTFSWECQSGACDLATLKCQSSFQTITPGFCSFFTIKDAGGGG